MCSIKVDAHAFIHSFIHPSIFPSVCIFVHSFIHSFVLSLVYLFSRAPHLLHNTWSWHPGKGKCWKRQNLSQLGRGSQLWCHHCRDLYTHTFSEQGHLHTSIGRKDACKQPQARPIELLMLTTQSTQTRSDEIDRWFGSMLQAKA